MYKPVSIWMLLCIAASALCLPTLQARDADEAAYFESSLELEDSAPGSASTAKPHAILPERTVKWIAEKGNRRAGDTWAVVTAGPYKTLEECEVELSNEIKLATDEFINEHLHSQLAAKLLNYEGPALKNKFASDMLRHEETVETASLGTAKQIHAKLTFGPNFQSEIEKSWNKIRQSYRLLQVGLVSVVVLSLLGTACGYFKAEQATGGSRSTNLQFLSATAILVIVVAGVSAARWLLWL
jgi:hypothetical protein